MKNSTFIHTCFITLVVILTTLNSYSQQYDFHVIGNGEFEQRIDIEIEDNTLASPISSIYWEVRQFMPDHIVYVYANDSVERINVNGIPYISTIYETEYLFEGFIESIELPFWETGIILLPSPILGKQITITIERRKVQLTEPVKK